MDRGNSTLGSRTDLRRSQSNLKSLQRSFSIKTSRRGRLSLRKFSEQVSRVVGTDLFEQVNGPRTLQRFWWNRKLSDRLKHLL